MKEISACVYVELQFQHFVWVFKLSDN